MKKFLTSILTLLLALCCFAGCGLDIQFGPAGQTSSVSYDVEAAAENLISNVRTSNGSTREDYEVPKQFFFDGATYTVTWSVSCEVEGTVAIVVGGEGALTDKVDVYENAATDIPYVLTATVKAGDDTTATRSLNRTVLAAPSIVPQAIDEAPVAGEAYKLHMYQSIKKADEYMTGEMNGFYYATTLDYTKSPDITVTPVEGKDNAFYLSFIKANVKYYIGVSNGWNATKDYWTNNAIFNTSLTAVEEGYYFTYEWNWNPDHQTMTTTYNARTCTEKQFGDLETPNADALAVEATPVTLFLGTTGTYYTFDALNVEDITGAHVGKLVKMVDKSTVPSEKKVEAAKLALNVATTYNGATTVELPTMDKTYPEVSITWAVKEGTEAANITLNGNVLTIANPSETVTTTLIASFTCGEGEDEATDSAEIVITSKKEILSTLTEGTAYKMYVDQNTLGKTIYATTSLSNGRITTTTSAKAATDIYAEIVEGGYKFYTLDGTTKNYMSLYSQEYTKNDGSTGYYNNIKFAADVSSVFTYNEEKNCWCAFIGTNEFYLGTYGSYDTISISFSSYITAANTGVSQFPANFVLSATAEAEDTTPEVTLPEAGSDITIAQANEYGLSGVTGANKYYVTGTITSITNTSYGNMYIEDSNGDSILIWGLYADANKETKYEAMTDKPVVGDIIKVYAALSKHNNAAQLPDAQLITLTKTDAGNVTRAFAALTAPESKVEATGDVTLPALDGVAVVWSVATNDYATVANNVLTVSTMPAETTELTLTATITIGSATDSKDFKVALFVEVSGRTEIAFEFGENGTGSSTSIDNGSEIGTAKDYSSNGYTLSLTDASKVYEGAYDATGKSCLKLGTGSVVATFTFVVPDDVHTVIIKAAKYKAKDSTLVVNGTNYVLSTSSNDGVYTDITIDTTTNKTVTVATLSSQAPRACIDSITFVVGFDAEEPGDSTGSDNSGDSSSDNSGDSSSDNSGDSGSDNSGDSGSDTPVVEYTPVSLTEAKAAAANTKVQVSGTVCQVNGAYCKDNMSVTITDGSTTLYIYQMATQVALGDVITVQGVMGTDTNGNVQIVKGSTATITSHDNSYTYVEKTITEAAAEADGANVCVTGTVVKLDGSYSSSFNNMSVYIADEQGNQLYIFRLAGEVALKDIITVKGTMATYSNTRQVTGGTFEKTGTHVCEEYTDATCKAPETCVKCGIAKDNVLADHNYVDGVCSVCGTSQPAAGAEQITTKIEFGVTHTYENSAFVKEIVLNNFTITADENGNTSGPKYYDSGTQLRLYPKNHITFTPTVGTIKSIKIALNTGKNNITADNATITNATLVSESDSSFFYATLTPVDGSKAVTATFSGSSGQWRIEYIEVIIEVPATNASDETTVSTVADLDAIAKNEELN